LSKTNLNAKAQNLAADGAKNTRIDYIMYRGTATLQLKNL